MAALAGGLLCSLFAGCSREREEAVATAVPERIDFNEHIRPILNQHCTACHGGVKMAGDISFVFREEATRAGESGRITIKPGDPEGSELIARITSEDPELRMPPVDHGAALAPEQIALFRRWIEQGAEWVDHWAFVPPELPPVPTLPRELASHATSPIDAFIFARLADEGLGPSPEADRPVLLRRVSLDLTGLPPTAAEIDTFLTDDSPSAYERQVDRLLASPHFGERWAAVWMDLARYADTKGYEKDFGRSIWKYRDWVIAAFNRNLPYDKFVIEQLAGDLLPEPTLEQLIATAFHRNTQTNDEGGTSDEEFRMSAVLDRVSTTWLGLNGVTFNCVQCHSHPYDPIRHEEFYEFLAFFNNTADADLEHEFPTTRIPDDPARYAEAEELARLQRAARSQVVVAGKSLAAEGAQWHPLPVHAAESDPAASLVLRDGEVLAEGTVAQWAVYELRTKLPVDGLTALRFEAPPLDPVKARHSPEEGFLVRKIDAWIETPDGEIRELPVRRYFSDTIHRPWKPAKKERELMAADPAPPGFYFAATPVLYRARWAIAALPEPVHVAAGSTLRIRISHGRQISARPAPLRRLRLSTSADPRWSALAVDPALDEAEEVAVQLARDLEAIPGTDLPVMEELPPDAHRETRKFARGNFLVKEGPPLEPDVPALFPTLPPDAPRNRLTMARWLVTEGHPLTSRVAVNRFWEQLFGLGLVETLEDFGSVGAAPSHPELLDWLAWRFERELKWDIKALLRELVTSATYRQDARVMPALLERDPQNRLLARGPRNRLTAEMVRDQALVAGGLLNPKLHGPPVMPPQPEGVWASAYNSKTWEEATGPDRYRRALYTYWKRTSAYPSLLTFDAPARDFCALRRMPTNTPLQALVTLNDPVYAEAAAALADRMLAEGGDLVREQLAFGFRLAASRLPSEEELRIFLDLYEDVQSLPLAASAQPEPDSHPETRHTALSAVAAAILNLDVVLTK